MVVSHLLKRCERRVEVLRFGLHISNCIQPVEFSGAEVSTLPCVALAVPLYLLPIDLLGLGVGGPHHTQRRSEVASRTRLIAGFKLRPCDKVKQVPFPLRQVVLSDRTVRQLADAFLRKIEKACDLALRRRLEPLDLALDPGPVGGVGNRRDKSVEKRDGDQLIARLSICQTVVELDYRVIRVPPIGVAEMRDRFVPALALNRRGASFEACLRRDRLDRFAAQAIEAACRGLAGTQDGSHDA